MVIRHWSSISMALSALSWLSCRYCRGERCMVSSTRSKYCSRIVHPSHRTPRFASCAFNAFGPRAKQAERMRETK